MTPGQRKWLEKLAADGPQRRPRYGSYPCCLCYLRGWTHSKWVDDETGQEVSREEVVRRKFSGVHTKDYITDAGREALNPLP